MKTRKTKKRNIIRRAVAFLLCMTMVLGLGMQDVIEQVYAEEASAVSREQSADVPATQEVESTETTTPEGETDPTASEETGPATPEEEPTAPEEDKKPAEPTNPTETEGNTEVTTPPTETTDPSAPEEPTTPADGTENTETDESTDLTAPVNPDGSNGSESSGETTSGEDTDTEGEGTPSEGGEELPVEEKPVSELTYAAEDGSFSVKAAAVSEDVELSGIEIHASQVQKDGEEYAAAEELVAGVLDAESRQIEELQAYDIWFTYTESGETADLSGQVQVSLEYIAPEFPEGTDAQLEVFCLNGGAAEAVDGTDALAAGCELYALAWTVPAESTDTWEWTDGQVIIKASADKGVLPEGAEISVTPIVKTEEEELANLSEEERAEAEALNEQYAQTEEKLTEDLEVQAAEKAAALPAAEEITADAEAADAASDSEETADASGTKTLEGFLAYDICFLVNGEEVEPADGEVNVSIEFNEAVIPEGVSEDAEVSVAHLKEEKNENGEDEIVVEDLTSAETTTVETTEKAEVKKVELITDSFSSFVIYWGSGYSHSITVKYVTVNEEGEYEEVEGTVAEEEIRLRDDRSYQFTDEEFEDCVEGYEYTGAFILTNGYGGGSTKTEIASVKYSSDDRRWTYRTPNGYRDQTWYTSERVVYLVYDQLHEVKTVDNETGNITMKMVDLEGYKSSNSHWSIGYEDNPKIDIGGTYGDGNVDQGLVKALLGQYENGRFYPVTTGEGAGNRNKNLGELFQYAKEVDNLFIQSTYDETGYYEYSSFENYAYLGGGSEFTVYEEIGTPEGSSGSFYFQRGNFFPYNQIEAGNLASNVNSYDENGNLLQPGDEGYGKSLYQTVGTTNTHFGMEMEVSFLQPENGIATHTNKSTGEVTSAPMIYEFNGDDDLWVYIDNVLVLDIGGVHDAHSGKIDFTDGSIEVHTSKTEVVTTTLKDMFRQAEVFPDGTKWDNGKVDQYFDGNTFVDFSNHNLKMFYLERGAGASNLHMKFNLQTVPAGTINVTKQLSNTDQDEFANVEFAFQVWAQKVINKDLDGNEVYDPDEYVLLNSNAYYGDSGKEITFENDVDVDGDGLGELKDSVFYLKPGETAQFRGLQKTRKYYVIELGVNAQEYEGVTIGGTEVYEFNAEQQEIGHIQDILSSKKEVYVRPTVVFENACSKDYNTQELQITKAMAEGQTVAEDVTFSFRIRLTATEGGLKEYTGKYYLIKYDEYGARHYYYYAGNSLVDNGSDEIHCGEIRNGIVPKVPVGFTVAITGLIADTEFEVTEIDPNPSTGEKIYKDPIYDIQEGSAEVISEDGKAYGTIELGKDKDAKVTVTNTLLPTPDQEKIRVQKTFKGLTEEEIKSLESQFKIHVDTQELTLTDNVSAGDSGEFVYTWLIPAGEDSQYSVDESEMQLEPYSVKTKVNGDLYSNAALTVGTNTFTASISDWNKVENSGESDIALDDINLLVIKQSNGSYVIWTRAMLSSGERDALLNALETMGITGIVPAEVRYFSTDEQIQNKFYYEGGKISLNGEGKLVFEFEEHANNVEIWKGNCVFSGAKAEIEVVNEYSLPEVDIDLKKYGTTFDESNLLSGARFSLYKGTATGETVTWSSTPEEEYSNFEVENGNSSRELKLGDGYYKLVEDIAPAGYQKLETPIYFKVAITANGGTITWIDESGNELSNANQPDMWQKDDRTMTIQIKNDTLYDLPEAGGPGIHLYMLGGTLLMMAGALLVYKKRKEEVLRS